MPKQILLVDDSVTIQRVVELTFAHEADYKVTAAKSADEGLARARKLLLVLDAREMFFAADKDLSMGNGGRGDNILAQFIPAE